MRRHFYSVFLLVALMLPIQAIAQDTPTTPLRIGRSIDIQGTEFRVLNSGVTRAPHFLISAPKSGTAIAPANANASVVGASVAGWFMQVAESALELPSTAEFRSSEPIRTSKIWCTTFQMSYGGISVADRFAKVVSGAENGEAMYVESNLPTLAPQVTSPSLSAPVAESRAEDYVQQNLEVSSTYVLAAGKLVYVVSDELAAPTLAYETLLADAAGAHLWRVRVDASNGEVLEARDIHEYLLSPLEPLIDECAQSIANPNIPHGNIANGNTAEGTLTTLLHPVSPYDSLVNVPMPFESITVNGVQTTTDSLGRWSVPNVAAPFTITTTFSDPFHRAIRADGVGGVISIVTSENPTQISWTNQNSDPAERDAFYNVGIAHHYIKLRDRQLSELDAPFPVNVNLNQTCNAFYNPADNSVNFFHAGGGCSNTGEIADVVFHEFGHGVTNARYVHSRGVNIVDGSLGEGFADLNSAFMRDDPRIGEGFFGKGSLLRNCDNTKKWPTDLNPDIHINGEIISGAFWDLRKLIGHATAQNLFYQAEYLTPDGTGSVASGPMQDAFVSVLMAVIAADDDDNNLANGTPHLEQILEAFQRHNINLGGLLNITLAAIPDQDSLTTGYPVTATVSYAGTIGTLNPNSVSLLYSTDDGATYTTLPLQQGIGSEFKGTIPKLPAGTFVHYYATASTSVGALSSATFPVDAPQQTLSFMIGYRRVALDDAEVDRGWSLKASTDRATTGLWTRDVPFGTFITPTIFVQQDSDHTPTGTYCYLTGNANAQSKSRAVGLDDVDNGSTTLTTPPLDLSQLSSPVLRYWYYYSNDAGSNPGLPAWTTFISNNGGASWKPLQNTTFSTSGWVPFTLKVSEYLVPTDRVQLKFTATDNVGAIVEAGVDDLEILESQTSQPAAVAPMTFGGSIGAIHPDPSGASTAVSVPILLRQAGHTTVSIKDILGRVLSVPLDRYLAAGSYEIVVKLDGLPAGSYWAQLTESSGISFRHFIVTK